MSILKSPLTILGILVIIAAAVLALGPFFINWNDHKAEFQRQASLLTGRDVTIGGPITVRLFPWPSLTASDVRISNPPGSLLPEFAKVDLVEAEIAAPALLSGRIEFEKLKLLRPVISLERLAAGGTSWNINPGRSLKGLPGADQIAIAGIDIEDGQVLFGDGRRGGLAQVTGVNGRLSAPALDGPWRIRLDAGQNGIPFSLNASTGKYQPGSPFNVALSITPRDESGFSWSFDGETLREDGKVKGRLTVAPAVHAGGKSNPLDSLWQVRLTSNLTADFDTVELRGVEVLPATDLASSNLVTGDADITLGEQMKVNARLAAASLDIDQMLGRNIFKANAAGEAAEPAAQASEDGPLHALSTLVKALPAQTVVDFDAGITSMIIGGETLTRVRLQGQVSPDNLRISRSTASLPGQTLASFAGIFLPTADERTPQLAGEIEAESVSLRDLAMWAMPDHAATLEKVWSGARGRARLTGQVGWTPDTFRLSGLKAALDDAKASGSLRIARGTDPSIAVRLVADTINIDRYAPRGFSSSAMESGTFSGLADLTATLLAYGDAQVTVQTDSLLLRGVEARDIAVDVDISEGAVELRTIEIGAIGDARLDIAGVLNFPDEGITGSVSGDFKANDPRPFLRLAGLLDGVGASSAWAQRLGPVDMKILSEVSTGAEATSIKAVLNGKAAGASISGTGEFAGNLQKWRDGKITLGATASGSTSANLVALAGLAPVSGGEQPAKVAINLSGTPSSAMSGKSTLEAFGATLNLEGGLTIAPDASLAGSGQATMQSADASALAAALGLPALDWPASVSRGLSGKADVVLSGKKLQLQALEASLPAGNTVKGSIALAGALAAPRMDATLEFARLDTAWLTGILTSSPGATADGSTSFDLTRLGWIGQKVTLTAGRADALPGLSLRMPLVGLERTGSGAMKVTLRGNTSANAPLDLSFTLKTEAPVIAVEGTLAAVVDAGELMQETSGVPALTGRASIALGFAGSGRSPSGLLSQLSGEGRIVSEKLAISGLGLDALMPALGNLASVEGLDGLITRQLSSGPLEVKLDELPLTLSAGIIRSPRTPFTATNASGTARLTVDLAGSRARVDVSAKPGTGEAPGLSMRLSGHPQALERTYDTGALKNFVVTNVLQQGMDKLEELQREEQRLIEEERKFREEQEALEAERRRRIIEERQAAESARRRAAEEQERLKSAAEARQRAEAAEQKKLEELIQRNLPSEIPADALLNPQAGGAAAAPAN